jgi:predicted ATP-dependent endonuclease of OLD family
MELPRIIPKIRQIKIKDYGIIKSAKINFKEGLNIIVGPNGSGKTTLINAIREAFENKNADVVLWDGSNLNIYSMSDRILSTLKADCILIDDLIGILSKSKIEEAFKILSGTQIITTMNEIPDVDANIIKTNNFELNE